MENYKEYYKKHENLIIEGSEIAKANNISLSKFKIEIVKEFNINNNEDQWTFDYESYLYYLVVGLNFETPTEWGKEFYMHRGNL